MIEGIWDAFAESNFLVSYCAQREYTHGDGQIKCVVKSNFRLSLPSFHPGLNAHPSNDH